MLNEIEGQYLLSGYDNDLYEKKLKYQSVVRLGGCKTNAVKKTTEVLWANYDLLEYQLKF